MSFTVDTAICTSCGLCATGCVCGLIAMNADGVPYIAEVKQASCVHCGHCAAVCPTGAVTLDGANPDKLEPADPPVPSYMVQHLLKTRRAIRNFQPQAVEDSVLQEALSLAAYAPTAHNARRFPTWSLTAGTRWNQSCRQPCASWWNIISTRIIPQMSAAVMTRSSAVLPALFLSMLLKGFFQKQTVPQLPAIWNWLFLPFSWDPAGQACS